ncbi:MAG: AAA family ATPase [Candidatus Acidiferrales bacterium]
MLLDYYQLSEQPFGVTPDSRYLYLGVQHREALASLEYITESNRGFVAMIAKPGMGKTSLLYNYLERLRDRARTAFVFRTDCNAREFMRHVLLDLGIDVPIDDLPAMHDALNRVLTEEKRGKRLPFVLVIDEAQNLSDSVLESIRLLSNFETPWMKLMQIVLSGQPQLADMLAKPSMVQLRQRIAQFIRLEPFNWEEVSDYIDCRLEASGCNDLSLFTPGARAAIAYHSEGIPRNINTICFGAMSLACAMNRRTIDRGVIVEAMADLAPAPANGGGVVATERADDKKISGSHAHARESKGSRIVRWIPKFALAASLVAIFLFGFQVNVNEPRTASVAGVSTRTRESVDTTGGAAPKPTATPEAPNPNPSSSTSPRRSEVVFSGQTLYGISQSAFGRFDSEILSEIRKLNPWLNDPNRIPAGHEMLLPSSTGYSKQPQRGADQNDGSEPPKQAQ